MRTLTLSAQFVARLRELDGVWEAHTMLCPLCNQRKAKRSCPGRGDAICASCCGSKRGREIACPPTCVYLGTAREHPPAAVRKQQELDVARLLPSIRQLTERQFQLFYVLHSVIARHHAEPPHSLDDRDVAEASRLFGGALVAAARGVVPEEMPSTQASRRLLSDLGAVIMELRAQGGAIDDAEILACLGAIEQGALDFEGDGPRAYIELVGRLLPQEADPASRLTP